MTDEIGPRIRESIAHRRPRAPEREVAAAVGMSADAFSRALNGRRAFAAGELARLADILEVSVYWLITGHPDPLELRIAARHVFNFDDRRHEEVDWGQVAQRLDDVALAYRQVDADLAPPPPLLPSTAPALRARLETAGGPAFVHDLAEVIERELRIDVIRMPQLDRAYSLRIGIQRAILVNETGNWFHQNWSIAHEVAHLILGHATSVGQSPATAQSVEYEKKANAFAADLLLPQAVLTAHDWTSMTPPAVAAFLWDAGVSTEALRRRLGSLALPVSARLTALLQNPTQRVLADHLAPRDARGSLISERMARASARRFPPELIAAHTRAVAVGSVSPATLAWMLDVDPAELENELASSVEAPGDLDWLAREFGPGES
ncbi:MAG: XRE family transcriptional regulator [Herbiconiux sp.]|nr:XRE family transcriptional regulator [Herbiconiux sp.]